MPVNTFVENVFRVKNFADNFITTAVFVFCGKDKIMAVDCHHYRAWLRVVLRHRRFRLLLLPWNRSGIYQLWQGTSHLNTPTHTSLARSHLCKHSELYSTQRNKIQFRSKPTKIKLTGLILQAPLIFTYPENVFCAKNLLKFCSNFFGAHFTKL